MQIAPSAYWRHAARWHNPAFCSRRAQRDASLVPLVQRVASQLPGLRADKVWRQLNREGVAVARCTVERLMRQEGLQGVRRGKALRTTVPDPRRHARWTGSTGNSVPSGPTSSGLGLHLRLDLAGLGLRGVRGGRVQPAHRGWRQSSSMHTEFVLDALEQALYDRKPSDDGSLTHHSDGAHQYLSIRYSERLAEAGIEPSVGAKGDSYDNALAETINGLYKAEGDPPARAVEDKAGGGTGNAGMGRLVLTTTG